MTSRSHSFWKRVGFRLDVREKFSLREVNAPCDGATLHPMEIVVANKDAARLARVVRADARFSLVPTPLMALPPVGRAEVMSDAARCLALAKTPLEIRVPAQEDRLRLSSLACRIGPQDLPFGSLLQISPQPTELFVGFPPELRVLVDGPALQVVYTARQLLESVREGRLPLVVARVLLVCRVLELCGTYARDPDNPRQGECVTGIEPLGCVDKLSQQLAKLSNMHGVKEARAALRLATDGIASPLEATGYCLLTLPPKLGGCSFPRPLVNSQLVLDKRELERLEHARLTPDLVWQREKIVMEFDSYEFHDGRHALWEDRRRIRDYQELGYHVIPVTFDNFRSVDRVQEIAEVLASAFERAHAPRQLSRVRRLFARDEFRMTMRANLSYLLPPVGEHW